MSNAGRKSQVGEWLTDDGRETSYVWKSKDFYIENDRFLNFSEAVSEMESDYYFKEPGKEADFENRVYDCIVELCYGLGLPPIKSLQRQKLYLFEGYRMKPDIIVFHTDNSITVMEIKKTSEKYPSTGTVNQMNAVGQLLLYKSVLHSLYPKSKIRLALVDNKIYKRTFYAFLYVKLPISLVEIQNDRVFVPYYAWGESCDE